MDLTVSSIYEAGCLELAQDMESGIKGLWYIFLAPASNLTPHLEACWGAGTAL